MNTGVKKFIFISLGILITAAVLFILFAYNADFSEGTRTGRIVKFSRKGMLFKTFEGQLDLGGIHRGPEGYAGASVWDFTVDAGNQPVLNAIDQAMTKDKRVKMYYEEKYFKFDWRGDTKYIVTGVEILNE